MPSTTRTELRLAIAPRPVPASPTEATAFMGDVSSGAFTAAGVFARPLRQALARVVVIALHMKHLVFGAREHCQVLGAVVQGVSIQVMHKIMGSKWPTHQSLRHNAMLMSPFMFRDLDRAIVVPADKVNSGASYWQDARVAMACPHRTTALFPKRLILLLSKACGALSWPIPAPARRLLALHGAIANATGFHFGLRTHNTRVA